MADGQGYIGRSPGDSSVIIARQNFTLSGVQTDFTFTSGYDPGHLDCFYNGVKLIEGQDYDANDGSTVGLTSAAQSGDTVQLIAYKAFNLAAPTATGGNFSVGNDLSVTGKLTVTGITSASDAVYTGIITADAFYKSDGTILGGSGGLWDSTAAGINTTVSVGIGTTRPDSIARSNNTKILNVGILTAYQLYGDGSNLSGISTAAVPGISTQLHSVFGTVNISGMATATQGIRIGAGKSIGSDGAAVVYYGDGSNLSGISTAAVPGISTQLNSKFGTVQISGITTFGGNLLPSADATHDLGSGSLRWANLYTTDLQLSNEGRTNDVDGTWGKYTIQEGESDLFLINRRTGKKYKFNLTEVE